MYRFPKQGYVNEILQDLLRPWFIHEYLPVTKSIRRTKEFANNQISIFNAASIIHINENKKISNEQLKHCDRKSCKKYLHTF